jgi:hypothetical protein
MAELALAHRIGTAVERAYLRSDMLDRRRALQQDWDAFCTSTPVASKTVVPLRRGRRHG